MTSYEIAQKQYDMAFDMGSKAFNFGDDYDLCPYEEYAIRNEWFRGWIAAKEMYGEPTHV